MGPSWGVASVVTAIILVLVLLSRTSTTTTGTILKTVFRAAIKFLLNKKARGLSFALSVPEPLP